jgi:hypothetical protein
MKIFVLSMMFSFQVMAIDNVAPHCGLPVESAVQDGYIVYAPKGNCEIVSLDVLTGRECKKFVKEISNACYQLGKIYETHDPSKKVFTTCYACQR